MSQRVKDILVDDFWIMPATPEYKDDGIPYITSKNIKNGIIDFTKVNYISQEAYNSISRNRPILVGDILISMIGTLGETAEVKESYGSFYGQNMFLVRINENKINKRYFLDFFKSSSVKRALEGKQNQSTQKYLKANHIEDLTIPMLKLDEQKLIAEQLDKLSYIIKLRTDELKKLDELIKARFVEMFGDVKHEEKYKGIPLRELCITMSGGTPSTKNTEYYEGNIPWITTVSLGPNHIDGSTAKGYITQEAIKNSATKLIPAGNILFGTRVGVGKSSINDVDICTNQDIIAIIGIDENRFNRVFIKHVLDDYQPYYDSLKKGATILGITSDDLKDTLIPDAPIDVQAEFVAFVDQVDKSKVAVQKALDETKLLFDSLMQKYFG